MPTSQLFTLTAGIVVPLLTQWLKSAKWFSFVQEDQGGRVKALAAVLSAVAALLVSWQSGQLQQMDVQTVLEAGNGFVQTLGMSALIHHWFIKKPAPSV